MLADDKISTFIVFFKFYVFGIIFFNSIRCLKDMKKSVFNQPPPPPPHDNNVLRPGQFSRWVLGYLNQITTSRSTSSPAATYCVKYSHSFITILHIKYRRVRLLLVFKTVKALIALLLY